jgi:hypothetical protein
VRGLRRGPCGCRGRGERARTGKKRDTNMWVVCAVRRQNRAPRSTLDSYRVVYIYIYIYIYILASSEIIWLLEKRDFCCCYFYEWRANVVAE